MIHDILFGWIANSIFILAQLFQINHTYKVYINTIEPLSHRNMHLFSFKIYLLTLKRKFNKLLIKLIKEEDKIKYIHELQNIAKEAVE